MDSLFFRGTVLALAPANPMRYVIPARNTSLALCFSALALIACDGDQSRLASSSNVSGPGAGGGTGAGGSAGDAGIAASGGSAGNAGAGGTSGTSGESGSSGTCGAEPESTGGAGGTSGTGGIGGVCLPTVFSTPPLEAEGIVAQSIVPVGDEIVYLGSPPSSSSAGTIESYARTTGTKITLVEHPMGIDAFVVGEQSLYFIADNHTSIYRAPLTGGTETLVESNSSSYISRILFKNGWLYWLQYMSDNVPAQLFRKAPAGQSNELVAELASDIFGSLTVSAWDERDLYYSRYDSGITTLVQHPWACSPEQEILSLSSPNRIRAIAIDDERIYWISTNVDTQESTLSERNRATGAIRVLLGDSPHCASSEPLAYVWRMFVDPEGIAAPMWDGVMLIPFDGSAPRVSRSELPPMNNEGLQLIGLDATTYYFDRTNGLDGFSIGVYSLAR